MAQDGGWIHLVELNTQRERARAHLLVNEVTPEGWRGRLQSVRSTKGSDPLAEGYYFARLGRYAEPHLVTLSRAGADMEIRCDGESEPSVLRERSEGE